MPMIRPWILLLMLVVLVLPADLRAQTGMKIVVLGDNITSGYQIQENEGYAGKLYHRLRDIGYQEISVINMSETGRTSSTAMQVINKVLVQRPDIVIIQLGANEANRGVNPDTIYNNIIDIAGKFQQKGMYVILFGYEAPESRGATYIAQLRAVYQRIADFYRVPLYPDILQGIRNNEALMLADGFHPNGRGVDVMIENTFRIVDAGLRWKWNRINEQRGYQPDVKEALPPAMPPMAEPELTTPGTTR
jgi:acyl-CoA thioesterase-1